MNIVYLKIIFNSACRVIFHDYFFLFSKILSGIPPMSNNQDKARHLIMPGLGSNCLQWLSQTTKADKE